MADIFISYARKERERVRPMRDALIDVGFSVFWDQDIPSGVRWDRFIRENLGHAKIVVVVWTRISIESDNVEHEAQIAKTQDKLRQILLDDIDPKDFPLGFFSYQAHDLIGWCGDVNDPRWGRLLNHFSAIRSSLQQQRDDSSKQTPNDRENAELNPPIT